MATEQTTRDADELRRRAEAAIARRRRERGISEADPDELVYDLEVHRIELELQNEELRAAQLELAESRDRYYELYDLAPVAYLTLDRSGRILEGNLAAAELLGVPRSALVDQRLTSFMELDQVVPFLRHLEQVFEASGKHRCDITLRREAEPQRAIPTQIDSVALPDDNGHLNECHIAITDLSERRQTESELRASEARYTDLVKALPVGVFVFDYGWRTVAVNDAGAALLKSDKRELIGRRLQEMMPGLERTKWFATQQRAVAAGAPVVELLEHAFTDNVRRWYETTTFPVGQGECLLVEDVTERVQVTEALRAAKDAAEASNAAKSAFLAAMSHEIRTPMNGIVGMAELLATTPLAPIQREYLAMVQDSAASLLQIINDILDFSQLEAERLELEPRPFRLRELVDNTVSAFADQGHSKGITLACRVAPDVPAGVIGDPLRIRQILVNLLDNAIKFTTEGEVLVEITATKRGVKDVELSLSVRDSGPGIPAHMLRTIFQRFERVDPSSTRRFGGLGLGLSIVSRLVQSMAGTVDVQSTVGQGSRFVVVLTLPVATAEQVAPLIPPLALAKLSVLVIDHSETNCRIVEERLRHWGMRPTSYSHSADALTELARRRETPTAFRLVLLDAAMPDMNAFTLAESLLAESPPAPPLIMMLSSGDRVNEVKRCHELGLDVFLLKPVKHGELLHAIERTMGSDLVTESKREKAAQMERLRVLVAEDNRVSQRLVLELLARWGHDVVAAASGREALAYFAAQPVGERFDVVLMDVQMPDMDGLQATAAIREREQATGEHVPIIALTAHAMKGDRDRCLAAGMDGYLSKPVRAAELRRALARHTGAEASRSTQEPVIDWSLIRERVEDQESIVRAMAEAFAQEYHGWMGAIEEAIAQRDPDRLSRAAHSLKGAAQALAAQPVARLAGRLELAGRSHDLDDVDRDWTALQPAVDSLSRAVTDYLSGSGARPR